MDNPNPARITSELWWFVERCLAAVPGTTNGGTWTTKRGYHSSRIWNIENGFPDDYSVRDWQDKLGPGDKTAAFDLVFADAQAGDYHTIMAVMGRFEAAYQARDPRLTGLREILGQADPDLYAEGFDCRYWYTRTPDSSHLWHIHFSISRSHVQDARFFRGLLSIVRGLTYPQWLQEETVAEMAQVDWDNLRWESYDVLVAGNESNAGGPSKGRPLWLPRFLREIKAAVLDVKTIVSVPAPVTLTADQIRQVGEVAGDRAAQVVLAQLPDVYRAAAEAAVRRVLGSLDGGATPPAGP